jgi:hypothetical protein
MLLLSIHFLSLAECIGVHKKLLHWFYISRELVDAGENTWDVRCWNALLIVWRLTSEVIQQVCQLSP